MKTYFDSSAFAKRFVDEDGSDEAEEILGLATELALSVICVPEKVIDSPTNKVLQPRRHRGVFSQPTQP